MGARLKFWRRRRVPKKGRSDEAVGISHGFAARDGSAVKSHSTILQRPRRQISLNYYTIPPATQASYRAISYTTPDLNIIENIWLYRKRELQKSAVDVTITKNDLLREIQSVWRNIELDYIRDLYQSIPDRLNNVIEMKGHLTKY